MTAKLYRAMLVDNFESASTRLWTAGGDGNGSSSRALETGIFVQDGDYSLKFAVTLTATLSGDQWVTHKFDYYGTPKDLSTYDYLFMWVYSDTTTDPPVLRLKIRNDGNVSSGVAFTGEVKDGWGLVKANISSLTRTEVEELRIYITETDYNASESMNFYLDTVCLVDNAGAFDLTNTNESIKEQEVFEAPEILFDDGVHPTFESGYRSRNITVSGTIPTISATNTAIIREAKLEDFVFGNYQFFFESDAVSLLVKIRNYNSSIMGGRINIFDYNLSLIEDFGILNIER